MKVERLSGTATELHHRPVGRPTDVEVWLCEVTRPAIVLGSRQTPDLLDLDACARDGVDVVHRRSGGGLVLLEPAAMRWLDVVVPATSRWWTDDVTAAMINLGEIWQTALDPMTRPGQRLDVHRGRLERSSLGDLVCFASLGPGEVTLGRAKLVGLSARRTRSAARFQCLMHDRWSPRRLAALLSGDRSQADGLDSVAVACTDALAVPSADRAPGRRPGGDAVTEALVIALTAALAG